MNRFSQTTLAAAILAAAAILPQSATAKDIRYVKQGASGTGLTWATASGDLQQMINESNPATDDEIWVYAGTYYPQYTAEDWLYDPVTPGNSYYPTGDGGQDNAFVLKAGVKIYGGFTSEAGTVPAFGTTGRDGLSLLSGDLGTPGNNTDNAYHVVISTDIPNDGKTVLDGFTVSGGNADGAGGSIKVNSQDVLQDDGEGYSIGILLPS